MTLESLARAIHEDAGRAVETVNGARPDCVDSHRVYWQSFDELSPAMRAVRMEQARLMFERIMR